MRSRQTYSIVSADSEPQHLKQFREWVDAQWDEVDPFSGVAGGIFVPPPILAIDDQKLLGGLAFTSSSIPGGEEAGVWVNALLVATEYRRIGIASELIKAAVVEAGQFKLKELFVYTDVPELYQKLSWLVVDGPGESTVLKRIVIN